MSRPDHQLPAIRRTVEKREQSHHVPFNLHELGLLDSKAAKSLKSAKKPKAVVFETPVAEHNSRPTSRASQYTTDTVTTIKAGGRPTPRYGASHLAKKSFSTRGMAGVLDLDRSRTRRERTFVGGECAVCEEPLEHILRGERVLQLSCGHVSHEACFYEYLREFDSQYCPTCDAPLSLDSRRGGNMVDIEKLSNMVRAAQHNDGASVQRSAQNTPTPWDTQTLRGQPRDLEESNRSYHQPESRQTNHRDMSNGHEQIDAASAHSRRHNRNDSGTTGVASSGDYAESNVHNRRHDYDVQSMETSLSSPRGFVKNPIPAPTVTVRSEFPTISRSRQQQSLTCLITVEVIDGKWRPDVEDMGTAPPVPSLPSSGNGRSKSPAGIKPAEPSHESAAVLDAITEDLHSRVDNWHGLDFSRFGKLRLHGNVRVGKDRQSWQHLECYLFSEMLICVKEKRMAQLPQWDGVDAPTPKKSKCTLKGSILIKKHLKHVETTLDENILTLSLSVAELPSFHLQFENHNQLDTWRRALYEVNRVEPPPTVPDYDQDNSGTDEEDGRTTHDRRVSSLISSYGAGRSNATAPTEYTNSRVGAPESRIGSSIHIPIDIVVVIPVSSSMQGLKINLLRDALRFLVSHLGDRDRMGLVTFGSSGGGVPLVGMTSKTWKGWPKILDSIRPVGQKSLRADVVEGANVAMDLLMQRKSNNPLSSILLISDSSISDAESVDFVVSRAEAAKVAIHSFGLGLTHKPDTMIELSTRTKATYTYVKDWMMLRECVAGCLGSLQMTSHQNVKLKLRLPEGSPAKFVKISGALQITKRATGRDAEAALGDLRFGDKRDILVQLAITPDSGSPEQLPQDPWETIVSGLEALGGPFDQEDLPSTSVEEVPLIQADLSYSDILREGTIAHSPRPSLLAITMLPAAFKPKSGPPSTPPIPPHPSVVQRRMELLTSDMLTRALTLVSRGQHERAHHLLSETRSILRGLGKGGLPPLPPAPGANAPRPPTNPPGAPAGAGKGDYSPTAASDASAASLPGRGAGSKPRTPSPPASETRFAPAPGIDIHTVHALDAELESSLEWINHPAVFGRDSRKQVLQAIGVISSQRAYTFRTPVEALWADRIAGVRRLAEASRVWREGGDEALMEEN